MLQTDGEDMTPSKQVMDGIMILIIDVWGQVVYRKKSIDGV
jgi:hypothetical protein